MSETPTFNPEAYTFSIEPYNEQPRGQANLSRANNNYYQVAPLYNINNKFTKKRIYNKFCPLSMRNIMNGEYYLKCKYCNNHFCAKEIENYNNESCPICNKTNYYDKYYINIDPNDKSYIFEKKPNYYMNYINFYAMNSNILNFSSGLAGIRYS